MADEKCGNPCHMESRIEQLEKDSERNANTHRIFYDKFESAALAQARSDERQAAILMTVTEIKDAVKVLTDKPAKRWESVIGAVLAAIAGGIIGVIIKGAIGV